MLTCTIVKYFRRAGLFSRQTNDTLDMGQDAKRYILWWKVTFVPIFHSLDFNS